MNLALDVIGRECEVALGRGCCSGPGVEVKWCLQVAGRTRVSASHGIVGASGAEVISASWTMSE